MRYVEISGDGIDPSTQIPDVPKTYIRCVTYLGEYQVGFRPAGLYSWNGGRAQVDTIEKYFRPSNPADRGLITRSQKISIQGKTVAVVRGMYNAVRSGKADIERGWEVDALPLTPHDVPPANPCLDYHTEEED